MSEFVEVKTAELVGPALDWMVLVAFGWEQKRGYVQHKDSGMQLTNKDAPRLSTDWGCARVLTERCCEMCKTADGDWMAVVPHPSDGRLMICYDNSLLVAMCRAIVEARLGVMVQVPAELVGIS